MLAEPKIFINHSSPHEILALRFQQYPGILSAILHDDLIRGNTRHRRNFHSDKIAKPIEFFFRFYDILHIFCINLVETNFSSDSICYFSQSIV